MVSPISNSQIAHHQNQWARKVTIGIVVASCVTLIVGMTLASTNKVGFVAKTTLFCVTGGLGSGGLLLSYLLMRKIKHINKSIDNGDLEGYSSLTAAVKNKNLLRMRWNLWLGADPFIKMRGVNAVDIAAAYEEKDALIRNQVLEHIKSYGYKIEV